MDCAQGLSMAGDAGHVEITRTRRPLHSLRRSHRPHPHLPCCFRVSLEEGVLQSQFSVMMVAPPVAVMLGMKSLYHWKQTDFHSQPSVFWRCSPGDQHILIQSHAVFNTYFPVIIYYSPLVYNIVNST